MKDILPQLLKGFFLQWMAAGRQLSPETVASYRDAFSLMLRWFRDERGTDASEVGMDDLTAENVEEFLLYLAERRGNSAQTVNCRLAAIKAFCSYAAYRAPERLAEMKRISDIPRRTEKRREVGYLTQEEVGWLLDACDAASRRGQEDHLLLSLLFSTGARISEAVALRMRSFERRGGRLSVHLAGGAHAAPLARGCRRGHGIRRGEAARSRQLRLPREECRASEQVGRKVADRCSRSPGVGAPSCPRRKADHAPRVPPFLRDGHAGIRSRPLDDRHMAGA